MRMKFLLALFGILLTSSMNANADYPASCPNGMGLAGSTALCQTYNILKRTWGEPSAYANCPNGGMLRGTMCITQSSQPITSGPVASQPVTSGPVASQPGPITYKPAPVSGVSIQTPPKCAPGWNLSGSNCSTLATCPPGSTSSPLGTCQTTRQTTYQATCPLPTMKVIGGSCTSVDSRTGLALGPKYPVKCANGGALQGSTCVLTETKQATATCASGTKSGNLCVMPATCAPKKLVGSMCV